MRMDEAVWLSGDISKKKQYRSEIILNRELFEVKIHKYLETWNSMEEWVLKKQVEKDDGFDKKRVDIRDWKW